MSLINYFSFIYQIRRFVSVFRVDVPPKQLKFFAIAGHQFLTNIIKRLLLPGVAGFKVWDSCTNAVVKIKTPMFSICADLLAKCLIFMNVVR